MKLLVLGHWSDTGFGIVTQNLGAQLVAQGVDVRVIAVNHRGAPIKGPLAGRVWPASLLGHDFAANMVQPAINGSLWTHLDRDDEWKPDVALAITDTGGLFNHFPQGRGIKEASEALPFFHYCPIEGDNLSIGWRGVWQELRPVAMSDYGARVVGEHIGRPVPRVYHGVNTDTFRPVAFNAPLRVKDKLCRTKEECKRAFGLDPTRRHILRTDRNVTRKFYYRLFEAFVEIADRVPDVDLVLHCNLMDGHDGINLLEEIGRLPPELIPRIRPTQAHDTYTGLPVEALVALMNAADIYVSTTGGEGFGLTLAESLACEVPVVVTDWAADAEVVGPGGVLVPPLMDAYGQPVRFHSQYGMDWAVPDPKGFVGPVVDLLEHPGRRRELGRAGRRHVASSFSWTTAAAEFIALFSEALDIPAAA